MLITDTNVLSEVVKPEPSAVVLNWIDKQDQLGIFTTTITEAELLAGVERLPFGRRRTVLKSSIERLLTVEFDNRILTFDRASAAAYAEILTRRRALGRPISIMDAMIAAIALSHGGAVATRNTDDFEDCGIEVINPWLA